MIQLLPLILFISIGLCAHSTMPAYELTTRDDYKVLIKKQYLQFFGLLRTDVADGIYASAQPEITKQAVDCFLAVATKLQGHTCSAAEFRTHAATLLKPMIRDNCLNYLKQAECLQLRGLPRVAMLLRYIDLHAPAHGINLKSLFTCGRPVEVEPLVTFDAVPESYHDDLAKLYYLCTGYDYSQTLQHSIACSLRELLYWNRVPKVAKTVRPTLRLTDAKLCSLSGLSRVPDITMAECLYVDDNQLTELNDQELMEIFRSGTDTRRLVIVDASHNQLAKIPSFITQIPLSHLYLNSNNIQEIPLELAPALNKLWCLDLLGNPLSSAAKDILREHCSSIHQLSFDA